MEGRTFPVDIFYLKEPCPDYMKETLETVMKIHKKNEPGDILVFLTSAEDCDSLTETLEEKSAELSRRAQEVGVRMNKMKVYRLYGSLPVQDQMKVFENTNKHTRKGKFYQSVGWIDEIATIYVHFTWKRCDFTKVQTKLKSV